MVGNHPVDGHRPRHGNCPRDCDRRNDGNPPSLVIFLCRVNIEHPRDNYFSSDGC